MATYNNLILVTREVAIDPVAAFSYPVTVSGLRISQNGLGEVHEIWNAGAPSTDFTKSPNGSTLVDTTNSDTYVKAGAVGSGIAGSWVQT